MPKKPKKAPVAALKYTKGIELEAFVRLVAVMVLYKEKNLTNAATCALDLIARLNSLHVEQRQPLFDVLSKAYYFYWRIIIANGGSLAQPEHREYFAKALRTAMDVDDGQGQATLINIQLNSLVTDGEYLQATQFIKSVTFPDPSVCSSAQLARYSYYKALLLGLEGTYPQAEEACQLALNRAPKHAIGFRAAVCSYHLSLSHLSISLSLYLYLMLLLTRTLTLSIHPSITFFCSLPISLSPSLIHPSIHSVSQTVLSPSAPPRHHPQALSLL